MRNPAFLPTSPITFNLSPKTFLHVMYEGEKSNELIIFLHGFPEFWYGWKNQIPFFADKNYYVVVPDLRGYNLSSKPGDVKQYLIEKTTSDIVLLIKELGVEKAIVVGHDWGGVIGWTLAMEHPELVKKLVLLNIPHPAVMLQYMKAHPSQIFKSAYIGFFQLPVLPEFILRFFDFKLLKQVLINTSKKGTFSREDIVQYKNAWRQPGSMKGMLNWYRAIKYSKLNRNKDNLIPTLLIWGRKDNFLSDGLAPLSLARCKKGTLKFLDDATHWLHHEKPDAVNNLIYDFINSKE